MTEMNAFEQLRAPRRAVDPDRRFVERLRADVTAAVRAVQAPTVTLPDRTATDRPTRTDTHTETPADRSAMTDLADTRPPVPVTAVSPEAIGTATLVPYLAVRGATDAIAWYSAVLGATETVRYTGDDGSIGHAELRVGGATFYLSDEYLDYGAASPEHLGGTSVALNLVVADVDTVFAAAVAGGAVVHREPTDQPYGERSCTVVDPWGHRWMIQTTIATPTVAEIDAAMADFTVTAATTTPTTTSDPAAGARVVRAPEIDERPVVHLLGIREEVPMDDLRGVIPRLLDDVASWLDRHAVDPGTALVRYHAIDPARGTVDVTVGFATDDDSVAGDDRVGAESLAAGRYASLVYAGLDGYGANAVLVAWADRNDVPFDRWDGERGDTFAARVELLLTGPDDDPDPTTWLTEVAIKLVDDGGAA